MRVSSDLISIYEGMVGDGQLHHDKAQLRAAAMLEETRAYLESTSRKRKSLLGALRDRWNPPQPPGLYLWGGVGAGKSMLMDLFFAAIRIDRKRRVHFHAFMQEIHDAIHNARQEGVNDPIKPVAEAVASEARLLCFDEMQITDITDAMIVGRLFEQLLEAGVTIITTSNRAPDDLYRHGLNRQLFLPFIDLIKSRMVVHHLLTELDYRQDRLRGAQTYFSPLGQEATKALDGIWADLTDGVGEQLTLKVKSRSVTLPLFHNGVARASFADLCDASLGAADYLAITEVVRVLLLDDIPQMTRAQNNQARRFVTLIDALYEAKTRLICSAAAPPESLYPTGTGAFEFERTASRLQEMQSSDWALES